MAEFDFSGYATRNNIRCSDGRTIRQNAFIDNDGKTVPLVWNHNHSEPTNVLGHALLENREDGVYAYCKFNDTESGQAAKELVKHGDIKGLSIYANKLKESRTSNGSDVLHGMIRELSLVLAGANPGAYIDKVLAHGLDLESMTEEEVTDALMHSEEAEIFFPDTIEIYHAEEKSKEKEKMAEEKQTETKSEKTIQDVIDTMNEEQKQAMYALVGMALEDAGEEGEDKNMKHNVFENDEEFIGGRELTHADQEAILNEAKRPGGLGTLQAAIGNYLGEGESLSHSFEDVEALFPEFKDINGMPPYEIKRDQGWVSTVMNGVHKSPISRIRTKQFDLTDANLRALGYKKGDRKVKQGVIKQLKRTTDPQTVYVKDSLHRDDIVDITDFDVVNYQWGVMKDLLQEELATAILMGDGRDDVDDHKIHEDHIRSIMNDDELYTIHAEVDFAAEKQTLQGTDTSKHFSDNYIQAEAILKAILFAKEKYKGSGNLVMFCDPHLVNVMLLARDFNGRRIYNSKQDLTTALDVSSIVTIEQMAGKTRETAEGETKKVLAILVNLSDYQIGCTKGGEITKFDDFDIDFNQYQYLIETRLSGTLTRVKSAIVLEEPAA